MADEADWLDEQQLQAWRTFSALLVVLPATLDSEMQRRAGITQFEYGVMAALSEAPGRRMRISTLAEFAQGSLSRLSHLIKRLERRGWVRREVDPADGRYTDAVLTDEGHARIVQIAPGHVADVRRLVVDTRTPAQRRRLGELGARRLRGVTPGGCPPS